ncbi:bifunctional acetylxylan esterase/glucomannan deacetylase AxeC2 [Cellvibrio fibrivorans]|uniref:Lysophospholipase L1-like esterase n=1 Tax=Cellvibrio fibrivorans TaxID=126350 RepID=A0ABU1V155_9GAMM|nr:bifunctional acetylxylan esterase/glucomannan deacetylase AxeC2 [Cellvibrio fibrivorans]MDR7091188.1 lysophospholipase L1-like esterase [Cellvibrio fibrivorans]
MKLLPISIALFFSTILLSGCTNAPQKHNDVMITIPAANTEIATMGRTHINSDKSLLLGFPGVSVKTDVVGKSLTADLQSSTGSSWVDVIVDNGSPTTIKITNQPQTVELFRFTEDAKHSVEIIHRTENWQGQVELKQFTLTGEKFLSAPLLPKRKMLVLGDSVTCGEAIDRVTGEEKNSRWWNARESYGMLTGKTLNAQVNLVCWGGRGLVRSWNGKTDDANLTDFYEFAVGDNDPIMKWDHTQYQPDLIVSAIGTNDFSQGIPEREAYVTAYVKLINKLLANHPQAHVALTEGAILNGDKKAALIDYIREAISRVNDSRVHQVTSNHYPGDTQDAHPTKEQHAAMAKDLVPQLKALMDW